MKAPEFDYERPVTLNAALAMIADEQRDTRLEYQVLAGGQTLMPMMHMRLAQPDVLVDLNALTELDFIRVNGDQIEIGAMTRYSTLEQSALITRHVPLFVKALPHIAHSAVRNRGTIGGSSALADPAAEMPALLKALNARLTLVSSNAERVVSADEFFTGLYETALHENEIIKTISIDKAAANSHFGFYEIARRHGDYAIAGVAITATNDKPLSGLRIVLFSVSDCALSATACERALEGKALDDPQLPRLISNSLQGLDFHQDLNASAATKQYLSGVVVKRALQGMMQ